MKVRVMFEAEIADYFLSNFGLSIMVVLFMFTLGLSLTGLLFSIISFYTKNKNKYIFLNGVVVVLLLVIVESLGLSIEGHERFWLLNKKKPREIINNWTVAQRSVVGPVNAGLRKHLPYMR